MLRRVIGFVLATAAMGAVAGASERIMLEGILVRVNDRIITVSEFSERVRVELSQMPAAPGGDELRQFTEMLLNEMVNELVLLERATEKKVIVEERALDSAIENLREENELQDDAVWQEALDSTGLTEDALRERYRRTMLLQRAVQGDVRPVEITEEELRRAYEADKERYSVPAKVELEQVFLPDEGSSGGAAGNLRRSEGLVSRVREGADLKAEAILAGAELQDLGQIPIEDCRPDLKAAIEGLAEGEVADPLTVPGGVQIIRLAQRIPAGFEPFETIEPELRRERSAETYESQTRGLVEKLKREYLVEVHSDRLVLVYRQFGAQ